jgi:hypothetical protein
MCPEPHSVPPAVQPFLEHGVAGEQSQVFEPRVEHPHRGDVELPIPRAGPQGRERGVVGRPVELVDVALQRAEAARDRQHARDVGGVKRTRLGPGVEQQQIAFAQRAVIVDPVQRRGVRAAATIE